MIFTFVRRAAGPFAEVSPEDAKNAAHEILSNPKYRPPESTPRPLSWLGRLEQRVFSAIGRFISRLIPGTGLVQWIILTVFVAILAVLIARILVRRTAKRRVLATADNPVSIDTLDAEADAALARGDYREAVILRFRAGIARLERGPRPAASRLTNGPLGSTIPVSFPPVATMFDDIRYGDRPAQRESAELSESSWPRIVDEARVHVQVQTDQLAPRRKRRLRRKV